MPDHRRVVALLVAALPDAVRHRVFEAAYADLREERRERLAAARGATRPLTHLIGALQVLHLVATSYRFAAAQAVRRGRRAERDRDAAGRTPLVVWQEVRQAVRLLRKQRGLTTAAVLTLALGIGASTAIFTVVDAVLLRPLPFPESGRLVDVNETFKAVASAVSPVNFYDWQSANHVFETMAMYTDQTVTLEDPGHAQRLYTGVVSAGLFRVLRVQPALGRGFRAEEDRAGQPPVVILSDGLWRTRFGRDRAVLGRTVRLDGDACEIVGVMPPGFAFPEGADIWMPLAFPPRNLAATARGAHYMSALARLRPGVDRTGAQQDMDRLARRLAHEYPRTNEAYGVRVSALLDSMVGDVQPALLILLGAVACVLLIACANVSNLLLARASSRRGEMAIRAALGAGRFALVRQLLTESLLLSLAAGACGLGLAVWGVRALLALFPDNLPRLVSISVDLRMLTFTLALSTLTGIAFGLVPALHGLGSDLRESLGSRRDSGGPIGGRGTRSVLVASELALALMLLVGAGLLVRSFVRLGQVDPGFNPHDVASIDVSLPSTRYPDRGTIARFYADLVSHVASRPGVRGVGAIMIPPLVGNGFGGTFTIEGRPTLTGVNEPRAQVRPVTPAYFATLEIPLAQGRAFSDRDTPANAMVAIVSRAAAHKYWPGEDPLGKRIRVHVNVRAGSDPFREIVGVVGDVKGAGLDKAAAPIIYVPHAQYPSDSMTIVARTSLTAAAMLPVLRASVVALDRELAPDRPVTLDDRVAASMAAPRFRTVLLSLFAACALGLAAIGLYGMVAYTVTQRTHEIGVRLALGAGGAAVVRQMMRQAMVPVLAGLAGGLAGAAAITRVIGGMLFGVPRYDPLIFVVVPALLLLTALVACYLPARRATRVDPLTTLRAE